MRWQRIAAGAKYIRQECSSCGRLVAGRPWATQTPENVALADDGGWYTDEEEAQRGLFDDP